MKRIYCIIYLVMAALVLAFPMQAQKPITDKEASKIIEKVWKKMSDKEKPDLAKAPVSSALYNDFRWYIDNIKKISPTNDAKEKQSWWDALGLPEYNKTKIASCNLQSANAQELKAFVTPEGSSNNIPVTLVRWEKEWLLADFDNYSNLIAEERQKLHRLNVATKLITDLDGNCASSTSPLSPSLQNDIDELNKLGDLKPTDWWEYIGLKNCAGRRVESIETTPIATDKFLAKVTFAGNQTPNTINLTITVDGNNPVIDDADNALARIEAMVPPILRKLQLGKIYSYSGYHSGGYFDGEAEQFKLDLYLNKNSTGKLIINADVYYDAESYDDNNKRVIMKGGGPISGNFAEFKIEGKTEEGRVSADLSLDLTNLDNLEGAIYYIYKADCENCGGAEKLRRIKFTTWLPEALNHYAQENVYKFNNSDGEEILIFPIKISGEKYFIISNSPKPIRLIKNNEISVPYEHGEMAYTLSNGILTKRIKNYDNELLSTSYYIYNGKTKIDSFDSLFSNLKSDTTAYTPEKEFRKGCTYDYKVLGYWKGDDSEYLSGEQELAMTLKLDNDFLHATFEYNPGQDGNILLQGETFANTDTKSASIPVSGVMYDNTSDSGQLYLNISDPNRINGRLNVTTKYTYENETTYDSRELDFVAFTQEAFRNYCDENFYIYESINGQKLIIHPILIDGHKFIYAEGTSDGIPLLGSFDKNGTTVVIEWEIGGMELSFSGDQLTTKYIDEMGDEGSPEINHFTLKSYKGISLLQ